MNTFLTKKELRAIYKEKRMALSKDELCFLSAKIFENFVLQFNALVNQCVSIFLPIKKFNEIDTGFFIKFLFEHQIRVFVPKIMDGKMCVVEIFRDSEYKVSSWGITEPVSDDFSTDIEFDIVLVPLLYCDIKGNRIGYGKGFYDQFFAENNVVSNKVGLSFFEPSEQILDVNDWDVKLDALITPNRIIQFV